jgi:hypothetical protein
MRGFGVFYHRGTEDTEVTSAIDDSVKSASKHLDIKVDQQPKPVIGSTLGRSTLVRGELEVRFARL